MACRAGDPTAANPPTRAEFDGLKKELVETKARVERVEQVQLRGPGRPAGVAPGTPDGSKIYAVELGRAPVRGKADAWVTIVEISDFQCPYCARGAKTLLEVEKIYGDDVRVVFKHNPLSFHQRAMPAALAAECAHAQGKFWSLADAFFADQGKLDDAGLLAAAARAGVDKAALQKCLASEAPKAAIAADAAQAAKLGARATPAFFINGRFLSGAQPLPAFRALVDEELAKAKKSGIPGAKYYAQVVEKGGQAGL